MKRRGFEKGRRAVVLAGLALGLFTALVLAVAPRAEAVITCYYGVTPPSSNCGYKGLASGGAPTGDIDRATTTGESMDNNTTGTSKRVRVISSGGAHVAGWWSSSSQFFLVTWGAQTWTYGQCNNMEQFPVSVNCGFQW